MLSLEGGIKYFGSVLCSQPVLGSVSSTSDDDDAARLCTILLVPPLRILRSCNCDVMENAVAVWGRNIAATSALCITMPFLHPLRVRAVQLTLYQLLIIAVFDIACEYNMWLPLTWLIRDDEMTLLSFPFVYIIIGYLMCCFGSLPLYRSKIDTYAVDTTVGNAYKWNVMLKKEKE